MKYKLINKTTGEEHICEKVVVDGWDYYVSDERPKVGDWVIEYQKADAVGELHFINGEYVLSVDIQEKVIATNNPNIDVPQVVDEVDVLGKTMVKLCLEKIKDLTKRFFWKAGFKCGYNKSQETHPNSDEDMIEFLNWIRDNTVFDSAPKPYYRKTQTRLSQEELIEIWKEQRTKILYYET